MTTKEAINRSTNLVSVSVAALAGVAFAPEILFEPEVPFKIDDSLLLLLGIGAVVWYRLGKNRYTHSVVPVILVVVGLLVKLLGVFLEIKDKEDVGDDFGGLVLFIAASILITYLFIKTKKLLAEAK